MRACIRDYTALLRETMQAWSTHRVSSMGAAIAFYTSFSLAPVLVIAIAIAGFVFGVDAARGEVVGQIDGLVGHAGAEMVQNLIEGARDPKQGLIASAIAFVALLVAATTVFVELKDSLDIIWSAERVKRSGVLRMLRERLLSFGLVLSLGFLLLVSLVVSAILSVLQKSWGNAFAGMAWLLEGINVTIAFAVVTALFAFIYKWLPEPRLQWRDVAVGSLFTAALFTLGKVLIGLYLGRSSTVSSFGAAGSLMVVLLWVYYSSQIFLFGAEFTRVYSQRRGSRTADRQ